VADKPKIDKADLLARATGQGLTPPAGRVVRLGDGPPPAAPAGPPAADGFDQAVAGLEIVDDLSSKPFDGPPPAAPAPSPRRPPPRPPPGPRPGAPGPTSRRPSARTAAGTSGCPTSR
jgi:hypothetical protein